MRDTTPEWARWSAPAAARASAETHACVLELQTGAHAARHGLAALPARPAAYLAAPDHVSVGAG